MAGHSKWSNIKNKKAKGDAARGRVFTKLGRELAVAVKSGGADPATNSRLYDVIAKCKAANMPNDNIQRGIKKAAGELSSINYESVTYEGYGIGGSAVIVEALTDNKNRTAGDVRHAFDKFGGAMGLPNSVMYMFDRLGVIAAERTPELSEDAVMEYAIESGADDVIVQDDVFEIHTAPSAFSAVRNFLEGKGMEFLSAEIELIPQNYVTLEGDKLETFNKMLSLMDDNDDIQGVFHNVDLPEDEEQQF